MDLWSEVTRIVDVIVSRSASLSTVSSPPSVYTLPGLDPSGNGRLLDLAAAAAAVAVPLPESEPPRVELAGPLLDIKFNVREEVPLVAPEAAILRNSSATVTTTTATPGEAPNYSTASHLAKMKTMDSGLAELLTASASSWTAPGACQVCFDTYTHS